MTDYLAILLISAYAVDIICLFLFGLHCYLMIYLYRKNASYCVSGQEEEHEAIDLNTVDHNTLPMVTVQLPVYNEFYVIDRLLAGTVALEWPKDKLEIQVLDDSTDESKDKAHRLVEFYRAKGYDMQHIHRTNREGHKAGALKEGLEVCKGEYVAIFDADFIPAPEFLRASIPYFHSKEIGMVQTRWGHVNEDYSILTKAQSFGIDGHFMIEQVARNCNDLWMNFNGTGGIWKKECILDAGNWQSDTLTEDFDLSYRAELKGWKFRYFKDVVNPAELPATISAFKSQQFRWCKGSTQTAFKLIPTILRSKFNWKIKAEAVVHLLNYSVHPLMMINILLTLPLLLLDQWTDYTFYDVSMVVFFTAATLLSLGTFGPTVFYLYSQRELYPDWLKRSRWLSILMMIGTGIAVSNTKAWIEAAIGKQSSFKRTPKYGIEAKTDVLKERMKYYIPLDKLVFAEIFMGIYCLACIYFSILMERPFVVPFMILYAGGFFYVAAQGIMETSFKLRERALKVASNQA